MSCLDAVVSVFVTFPSSDLLYPSPSQRADVMTTGAGVPVGDKLNVQTVGPRGPLLVQDVVFTDEMAHFDRERIPERVVHAKGAGVCFQRLKYKLTNQSVILVYVPLKVYHRWGCSLKGFLYFIK